MNLQLVLLFIYSVSGNSNPNKHIIITKEVQNTLENKRVNPEQKESKASKENSHSKNISVGKRYKPEWNDLDTRPLPEWYDRAKIGIFLHWGVYSVPSFSNNSEWFWSHWMQEKYKNHAEYMANNYPSGFTYQQLAPSFRAEFFDPNHWAELFKKAGAKYVVLTSKHHEGFTLFPSKQSFSWNALDVGPHRDLVRDVATAVRKHGLEFGVYYSLYEWFNPLYLKDKASRFSSHTYIRQKLRPDIEQLVFDYEPSVIWADGDWEPDYSYWNSTDILAWLYNESPVKDRIVVNDRWGIGTNGKHGDFYNHVDRFNPGVLQKHKWETAFQVDSKSWGYRRNMLISDILTTEIIIQNVVSAVSCGGNALINVGPTKEGTIDAIFEERLLNLGKWLAINGEAIYNSSPWFYQKDSLERTVWYTCTKTKYNAMAPISPPQESDTVLAIYAIVLKWPGTNVLILKDITSTLQSGKFKGEMLGQGSTPLSVTFLNEETNVRLPDKASVKSEFAWTLKFTHF